MNKKLKNYLIELDNRLNLVHVKWCKSKDDSQLLQTLLQKKITDPNYFAVNSKEIFTRNKN